MAARHGGAAWRRGPARDGLSAWRRGVAAWNGRAPAWSRPRVRVEAAPGLLAQMPRLDQVHEHLRRRVVLRADAVVQDLHDVEADVEADEVGQLERAHRVVEPDLRAGVDVVRGRAAF